MISLSTLALLALIAGIPTLAGAAAGYFAGHKSGTAAATTVVSAKPAVKAKKSSKR